MSAPLALRSMGRRSVGGRRRLAAGLLALALLAAIRLWWSAEPDPRPTAPVAPARAAPRVDPPQRAAFAILRTPATGLPARVRRRDVRDVLGLNPALAHPLPIAPRGRFWVVPRRGSLCLLAIGQAGQPASSCAENADALRHGAVITLLTRTTRRIVGVEPDGTRRVRIHTYGGAVSAARVTRGVLDHRDHAHRPPDLIEQF